MEEKAFIFSLTEICNGTMKVYAKSEEEAKKLIETGEYCFDVHDSEFTNVELIAVRDC